MHPLDVLQALIDERPDLGREALLALFFDRLEASPSRGEVYLNACNPAIRAGREASPVAGY